MKKSLFWLLALVLSPIAVLVIITPMDSQKQYLFGLLSIGILFLMGFSKKRSISVIMVVTSLLMSTRYMYFRLTQTLHFNSTIETVLGMGLFLAEVYIWVMLLLNYGSVIRTTDEQGGKRRFVGGSRIAKEAQAHAAQSADGPICQARTLGAPRTIGQR